MNIGLIVYGPIDTLTGGYLYDRRLVEYLRTNGHRVDIFSLPNRTYALRLLDNFSQKLWNRISGLDLDVLLQDELCHPSLLYRYGQRSKWVGPPAIAIVHHLMSEEPRPKTSQFFLRLIEKRYLDSVDGFIFNSRTTLENVVRISRHPRPCVVAPPGANRLGGRMTAAEVDERAQRQGPLRLLYVGLVIPRKGLFELIEALRRVPVDRWRLEIVGCLTMAPGYVRRIQRYIRVHHLTSTVRFHGSISNEALAAEYAAAHLLCMPYAYEGFGIVAAEAMSMGLPVLGSKNGAIGKLVKHGVTGLLFSPNEALAIAAAVSEMYSDRPYLSRMSLAALKDSGTFPTWKQSMQRVELFLDNFRLQT